MEEEPLKNKTYMGKSFLLTLLVIFFFTSFALISVLFLVSLFYSGTITRVINLYIPETAFSPFTITAIITCGFLFHAVAAVSILFIGKLRKKAYFLFSLICIIIASYQLMQQQISPAITAVYISGIIFFGTFYKRFK